MTVKRRCAMILVMSSDYRDSCLPYPQEIINKTHHKLPVIANKRNEDLLTIIKVTYKFHFITVIAKIKELPQSLLYNIPCCVIMGYENIVY